MMSDETWPTLGTIRDWMEEQGCPGCAEAIWIAADKGDKAAVAEIASIAAEHLRGEEVRHGDGEAEGTALELEEWLASYARA